MEEILDTAKTLLYLITPVLGWYLWSIKKMFISKESFDKEIRPELEKYLINKFIGKEEYYKNQKKQDETLVEIKTDYKHIVKEIKEIKELLVSRK